MSISIVQTVKNQSAYQVQSLPVTLKAATTAGSYIAVLVEAQKSGYPYASGSIASNTPAPTVTDDKGNTYTLVDSLVSLAQDASNIQPDAAGYYQSLFVYVSSAAATAGTQTISVSAFYTDEYNSPPLSPPVHGRPVFDGGLHAQAFEIAGLSTGVDQHGHGAVQSPSNTNLGPSLLTTSGAAIILEVGVLLDSASIIAAGTATSQHAAILSGGTSHFVVQSTIVSTATASAGFQNALKYSGGVVALSLK